MNRAIKVKTGSIVRFNAFRKLIISHNLLLGCLISCVGQISLNFVLLLLMCTNCNLSYQSTQHVSEIPLSSELIVCIAVAFIQQITLSYLRVYGKAEIHVSVQGAVVSG